MKQARRPDKIAYVDEEMFAFDDTVKSVKVGDKDFDVTAISQEIIDGRALLKLHTVIRTGCRNGAVE